MLNKGECYYWTTGEGTENEKCVVLTNFVITGGNIIQNGESSALYLTISDIFGTTRSAIFTAKNLSTVQSFREMCRKMYAGFSIHGMTITHLNKIIESEIKDMKISKVYDSKGLQEGGEFISSTGVFYNNQFYPFDENHLADLGDRFIQLKEKESTQIEVTTTEIISPIEDFRSIFNGPGGDLMIGFQVSSLFIRKDRSFPILAVIGRKGSGKTHGVRKSLNFLGATSLPAENIETSTQACDIIDLSALRNYPLWRDEYKNSPQMFQKVGLIKGVFDRKGISKGKYDDDGLGKNDYPILSSLIISGEQLPDDEAILSRCCVINVSANRVNDRWEEIKNKDYSGNLLYLIENYDKDRYEEIFRKVWEIIPLKDRPREVYTPVIAGYLYYTQEEVCIKPEWIELFEQKQQDEEQNDIVTDFFEHIESLSYTPILNLQNGFIHEKNKGIWIYLSELYIIYNKSIKYGDRKIDKNSLRKILLSDYGGQNCISRIKGGLQRNGILLTKKLDQVRSIIGTNVLEDE